MSGFWTRFKSLAGAAGEQQSDENSSDIEEVGSQSPAESNSDVSRLRRSIADLKASKLQQDAREAELSATPAQDVEAAPETISVNAEAAEKVVAAATAVVAAKAETEEKTELEAPGVNASAAADNNIVKVETIMPDDGRAPVIANDEALSAAQRLMAEQRKAAEALLSEVCALEERLNAEALEKNALGQLRAANEKAEGAAILVQHAKELAQAASQRHRTLADERKSAEDFAAKARADAEAAKTKIAELQEQLREARQVAEQKASSIGQHEARAKECAQQEAAAQREATEADARVVESQAACEVAANEAKAAEQRAAARKQQLATKMQNGAGEVQNLAQRIAEQASALARAQSSAGKSSNGVTASKETRTV